MSAPNRPPPKAMSNATTGAVGVKATQEAENGAHIHHALDAEVEVAGLFGEDLAQRAQQQRHARGGLPPV